jgi:hypothetical protein
MSHDLALYTTAGAIAKETRRTGRALSRIQGDSQIRQADVDAELDVTCTKLDAVTSGTEQAMRAVGRVARLETVLAQIFFAYLAEGHMVAADDIVEVMARRVRHK